MKKGFTLIEIMTAVSIFLVVMTIMLGAILGIFDANRKSQAENSIMNNLNLAIESMSKEMRFGTHYSCSPSGDRYTATPANCSAGGSSISFLSSDGKQTVYRFNAGNSSIEKSTDGGLSFATITAPEVTIESLTYYVLGAVQQAAPNALQPKVLIKIKGFSQTKTNSKSEFTLETLASQRLLNH